MIEVNFRTAAVTISEGIVTAIFADGKVNEFNLHWADKPDYRQIASEIGYKDNWMRYGIEHELCHHFIADKLGWKWSWAVHDDIHYPLGTNWPDHIAWEEHLVNSFQKFYKTDKLDEYNVLDCVFGNRLRPYKYEFYKLCTNIP